MEITDFQKIELIRKLKDFPSLSQLAQYLGLKNSQIFYDIKAGKQRLSRKMIDTISEKIPEINKDWLFTGNGEMVTNDNSQVSVKIEHSAISSVETATNCTFNNNAYQKPNFGERAGGDFENVLGCPDGVLIPVDIRTIPKNVRLRDYCLNGSDHDFRKEDLEKELCFKYEIRTNLLWPRLFKGDIIMMYYIKDRSQLINGRCYLVDCPVHGKMIKRLYIHESNYVLVLPDPKENYPILEIPREHLEDVDFYEIVSRISTDIDSVFCEESYNYQHLALTLADNEKRLLKLLENFTNNKTNK